MGISVEVVVEVEKWIVEIEVIKGIDNRNIKPP